MMETATPTLGSSDVWYDGVDQDCGNDSDYDQDGDGQDLIAYGGTDCNDTDSTIFGGATDIWYDGVDRTVTPLQIMTKTVMVLIRWPIWWNRL